MGYGKQIMDALSQAGIVSTSMRQGSSFPLQLMVIGTQTTGVAVLVHDQAHPSARGEMLFKVLSDAGVKPKYDTEMGIDDPNFVALEIRPP